MIHAFTFSPRFRPLQRAATRRRVSKFQDLEARELLAADVLCAPLEIPSAQLAAVDVSYASAFAAEAESDANAVDAYMAALEGETPNSQAVESAIAEFTKTEPASPLSNSSNVFQDEEGAVHVFATDQADLIQIYEFEVLGVALNGRVFHFDPSTVTRVVIHHRSVNDDLAVASDSLLIEDADPSPIVGPNSESSDSLSFGINSILGGEGEGSAPKITGFFGYEVANDMWLFEGAVTDDKPVGGLFVQLSYMGQNIGQAQVQSDGSFQIARYFPPGSYGYVIADFRDSDNISALPKYTNVNNPI